MVKHEDVNEPTLIKSSWNDIKEPGKKTWENGDPGKKYDSQDFSTDEIS